MLLSYKAQSSLIIVHPKRSSASRYCNSPALAFCNSSLLSTNLFPPPLLPLSMSVHSTHISTSHTFTKPNSTAITLIASHGVLGDCHAGPTVQHRSRLHINPPPPNLRQVHLLSLETLQTFDLDPGALGENITASSLDLHALGRGTKLHFLPANHSNDSDSGDDKSDVFTHAVVRIEGLRNPCPQIEWYRKGLQERFVVRDEARQIIGRKAGVMGTVAVGGPVQAGMMIMVEPVETFKTLDCV